MRSRIGVGEAADLAFLVAHEQANTISDTVCEMRLKS